MSSPLGAPHPPQAPLWPASSGLWALGRSHQTHGLTEDVERPLGSFTLTSRDDYRDLERFRRFLVVVILQNRCLSQKKNQGFRRQQKQPKKKSLPAVNPDRAFQKPFSENNNLRRSDSPSVGKDNFSSSQGLDRWARLCWGWTLEMLLNKRTPKQHRKIIFPTTFQRGYVSDENFKGTRIKNRTWTLKHNQIKKSHLLGEKRELKGAAMWHAIRGKPPWKHPQLVNKNHCRDTMKVSHVDSVFAQQRTIDPGSRERTWPTGPALEKESSLPKLPKGRLQSRVNAHSFFNIKSQQIRRLLSTSKVINIHNKHQHPSASTRLGPPSDHFPSTCHAGCVHVIRLWWEMTSLYCVHMNCWTNGCAQKFLGPRIWLVYTRNKVRIDHFGTVLSWKGRVFPWLREWGRYSLQSTSTSSVLCINHTYICIDTYVWK